MSDEGMALLLAFDTDDEQFSRGWEAGRVYGVLGTGQGFDGEVHASNVEMFVRIAERFDREHRAEIHDETWLTLSITDEDGGWPNG